MLLFGPKPYSPWQCDHVIAPAFAKLAPELYASKRQVVRELTTTESSGRYLKDMAHRVKSAVPRASDSALRDFVGRNRSAYPVADLYQLGGGFELVAVEELKRIFNRLDGWSEFRRLYPDSDGVWTISAPGLSRDMGQVVVCVGRTGGPLAGHGIVHVLELGDRGWAKAGGVLIWES